MLGPEPFSCCANLGDEHLERGDPAGSGERGVVLATVDGQSKVGSRTPELAVAPALERAQALGLLERGLPDVLGPVGPGGPLGLACGFGGLASGLVPFALGGRATGGRRDDRGARTAL